MNIFIRGIKNAFRNSTRTLAIVFILAVSIAMAMTMFIAYVAVQNKIANVKSSIGNTITVSPAGARGFEGGGEPLTQANVDAIKSVSNVSSVIATLSDRLTTNTNTNLNSAIDPGTLGNRARGQENNSSSNSNNNRPANFTMPIMVTGISDPSQTAALNVSQLDITSGDKFAIDSSENVALVGSDLATKNNLSVNSTFKAYNTDVKVVGIFDSGNKFSNSGIIMPLKTIQTLSSQMGDYSSIIVLSSSIDTISQVQADLKTKLGDSADVVSSQDTSNSAVAPLENIKTVSIYSLVGSLFAGAVIILMTMMMIVRERRREIGVLKAIGSSNIGVVWMFIIESLSLTTISSVVGIVIGILLSNPVLKVLVNNSSSSTSTGGQGGPGGGMRMMSEFLPNSIGSIKSLQAVVNWEVILYGVGFAILIGIIGSAIPGFLISKVKPAEALRSE